MSDIITPGGTGIMLMPHCVLLYNRSGAFIAEHLFANDIGAVIRATVDDAKREAADWLDSIGYRLDTNTPGWVWPATGARPLPLLHAVECVGHVSFEWEAPEQGRWVGEYEHGDTRHNATVHRTREMMLGANDVMWVVRVDGRHITNADTRRAGQRAANRELRQLVAVPA